jgi:sporulation protein YlmC with PRC-barrel domain
MKRTLLLLVALGLAAPWCARAQSSYTVFRVCQDQRVIHTSDGAEVGHVQYIVVDPGQQRIVSTVVSGGVLGDRYVAVPYEDIQMQDDNNIVLTNIDRERIASAPALEVNRFTSRSVIEPSVVEPSVTYFGNASQRTTSRTDTSAMEMQRQQSAEPQTRSAERGDMPNAQAREAASSANEPSREQASDIETQRRESRAMGSSQPGARNGRDTRGMSRSHHRAQREQSSAESSASPSASPASSSQNRESRRNPEAQSHSSREQATERARESSPRPSANASSSRASRAETSSDRRSAGEMKHGNGASSQTSAAATERSKDRASQAASSHSEEGNSSKGKTSSESNENSSSRSSQETP